MERGAIRSRQNAGRRISNNLRWVGQAIFSTHYFVAPHVMLGMCLETSELKLVYSFSRNFALATRYVLSPRRTLSRRALSCIVQLQVVSACRWLKGSENTFSATT
jgi:hypothetical protein